VHVRNNPNLGHLRNYNKGISLARGRYIWLISADDYLRKPYILERYVRVLDENPSVGYAYCAGVGVIGGKETEPLKFSLYAASDRIISGHDFLKALLKQNIVLAASGIVRRKCYEELGVFPLDMPFAGDWYLWCLFALHYDVAYFAEPMVAYRQHDMSMTTGFIEEGAEACCQDDVAVLWAIKSKADEAGFRDVSRRCLCSLGKIYGKNLTSRRYGMSEPSLSVEQFESALCRNTASEGERKMVRGRAYDGIANQHYWRGQHALAKEFYEKALRNNPWSLQVHIKNLLLNLGGPGDRLRKAILSHRSV
jgi:tetratricopeptide (TPR) repeat protein